MAKKPVITNVDSGFSSQSALNANFLSLQNAFDNTLSLDGSVPNAMQADLDINNNSIINAGVVETDSLILNGVPLTPSNAAGAALTSLTAFGASLIDDQDNIEALGTLGLPTELQGVTATAAELNTLDGITATTAELNIMDGITATTAELNTMDGILATTEELNFTDGVTSNIQTQIDAKYTPVIQTTATWEDGTGVIESLVSPAKIAAMIEELGVQTGSGTAVIGTLKIAWGTVGISTPGTAVVSLPHSYASTSTYGVVGISNDGNHPGATRAAQGVTKLSGSQIRCAKAAFAGTSYHWLTIGY